MQNVKEIMLCLILTAILSKAHLNSRTATKLVREWIDLHIEELEKDWQLAQEGKDITNINPLN